MAYRFRRSESIPAGIRRIYREQIGTALLSLANREHVHEGVHQARKNIKCLRALLRLIRPGLGKTNYRTQNATFRDIARTLSDARDAQAMLETLDGLELYAKTKSKELLAGRFRKKLIERHRAAEKKLNDETLLRAFSALQEQKRHFDTIDLKSVGFSVLAKGLQKTYRSGGLSFVVALENRDGEHFHEWRKDAQRHWRQMQLLYPAWPQLLSMREKYAHNLSRLLGDDHDLDVLGALARDYKDLFGKDAGLTHFQGCLEAYQDELREQAAHHGHLLYAEKPADFRARMTAYWEASVSSAL